MSGVIDIVMRLKAMAAIQHDSISGRLTSDVAWEAVAEIERLRAEVARYQDHFVGELRLAWDTDGEHGISEGFAADITGLDRFELRKRRDEYDPIARQVAGLERLRRPDDSPERQAGIDRTIDDCKAGTFYPPGQSKKLVEKMTPDP